MTLFDRAPDCVIISILLSLPSRWSDSLLITLFSITLNVHKLCPSVGQNDIPHLTAALAGRAGTIKCLCISRSMHDVHEMNAFSAGRVCQSVRLSHKFELENRWPDFD
jgi:hypothetical protein